MPPRAMEPVSELTAVALTSLHPTEDEKLSSGSNKEYNPSQIKQEWIKSSKTGGWGNPDDLGPDISSDCLET